MRTGDHWIGSGSGILIIIAAVIAAPITVSCAAPMQLQLLEEEQPYRIALGDSTRWEYWKIDTDAGDPTVGPVDTLLVWVSGSYRSPGNPIRIDPLVNLAIEQSSPPFDSFHLPSESYIDSTGYIEELSVEITGSVFRIASRGSSSMGKYPHFVANSSAGLLDLTSWNWPRNRRAPVPVYRSTLSRADLIVPGPGSRIGAWHTGDSGWIVTAIDTMLGVPLGEFRCIEISYYTIGEPEEELDLEVYREYWAQDVGLVAWIDRREYGDGHWVLAKFEPGVTPPPNDLHER